MVIQELDIERVVSIPEASFYELWQGSNRSFDRVLDLGYDHWILTFSGGKDSTLTTVLALEYIKAHPNRVERVDVIYSDTLVEIPSIHGYALEFLAFIEQRFPEIHVHRVKPAMENRFWVKVLGYGYPPPHQKFRWCTHRMKIKPCEEELKDVIVPDRSVVMTGVRFGESKSRDQRLNASCVRGGECGQGMWFDKSEKLKIGYLAPIVDWPACDLWDYLMVYGPKLGYPTSELKDIYGSEETRFGCWTCTVVRQDKAMKKTIEKEKWAHLEPLYAFRNTLWESTRSPATRVLKKDGSVGKLTVETRQSLLLRLLCVQDEAKYQLIDDDEMNFIRSIHDHERQRN